MNYTGTFRTNYFHVTDEAKFEALTAGLCAEEIECKAYPQEDGTIVHMIYGGPSLDWVDPEGDDEDDYNYDEFIRRLQKLLPDDDVFVIQSVGEEGYRYVSGYAQIVTSKANKFMALEQWVRDTVADLMGEDFSTKLEY